MDSRVEMKGGQHVIVGIAPEERKRGFVSNQGRYTPITVSPHFKMEHSLAVHPLMREEPF